MTASQGVIVPDTAGTKRIFLNQEEARAARRELRRRKVVAFSLVIPLLLFLIVFFVTPIATMLYRGIHNPTVAELIPKTLQELAEWNEDRLPDKAVLTTLAFDLKRLAAARQSGKLAEEINRYRPGASSVIKSTARRLRRKSDDDLSRNGAALLLAANKKWFDLKIWRAIKRAGSIYTARNYLTAMDLERNPEGDIQSRSTRIYIKLYI